MRLLGLLAIAAVIMPADPPSDSSPFNSGKFTERLDSIYAPSAGEAATYGTHQNAGFCARFPQLCLTPAEALDLGQRKFSYGSRLFKDVVFGPPGRDGRSSDRYTKDASCT